MGRDRRRWWNSFAIEQNFKQRQLVRVLGFSAAYVAISTVAVAVFYQRLVAPMAAELPPDALQPPGLAQAVGVWATLMMGLSALFATATGLYFGHKLAGPLYRFKTELRRIADGKPVRRITLRAGDEFHDVADALNDALERVERAEGALVEQLESDRDIDAVRASHEALIRGLDALDTRVLPDDDRARVEGWREELRAVATKLDGA